MTSPINPPTGLTSRRSRRRPLLLFRCPVRALISGGPEVTQMGIAREEPFIGHGSAMAPTAHSPVTYRNTVPHYATSRHIVASGHPWPRTPQLRNFGAALPTPTLDTSVSVKLPQAA